MKCLNCHRDTTNPKFCSRSCAASHNNKVSPKRSPEGYCKKCHKPISSGKSYCSDECRVASGVGGIKVDYTSPRYTELTLEEVRGKAKYQKSSRIRDHARSTFLVGKSLECSNCGYTHHVHVCHIKPISSFSKTATLGEINASDNLVLLCPNCHWEFDHGLLNLQQIT